MPLIIEFIFMACLVFGINSQIHRQKKEPPKYWYMSPEKPVKKERKKRAK
jgi:hypothetical protein